MSNLDARMIAAHEAHDLPALITLYTQAADTANDIDAACFYLTHAYIFALEAGAPWVEIDVRLCHGRAIRFGRNGQVASVVVARDIGGDDRRLQRRANFGGSAFGNRDCHGFC